MALPVGYSDPPSLPEELRFYWAAFWELSSERSFGFGIGPIPHSAIRLYADANGVRGDFMETFIGIIRRMDGEYRTAVAPAKDGAQKVNPDDAGGISEMLKRKAKRKEGGK